MGVGVLRKDFLGVDVLKVDMTISRIIHLKNTHIRQKIICQ